MDIYKKNNEDYKKDFSEQLKRQKNEIGALKKDNDQLKSQLAQAQSGRPAGPRPPGSAPAGPSGKRLQNARVVETKKDAMTALERKIETEAAKLDEFDRKCAGLKAKVSEARENMGGINITKESNLMIDKQIKVLENRLDKALIKFNEALHINKELREQIDNLRRERGVFDTIYKKLERELQEKKKEMAFIIEVSNIAYEERDNAQNELSQLKLYASKEMQSFEETFRELDELLEEDRKMKEAIKQRMAERKDKPDKPVDKSTEEEAKARHKKPAGNAAKTPAASPGGAGGAADMSPQNYEEAFNKIKAATNMSDINLLVSKFLHSEDDNFSLFNYVNELNNEIEKLEDARNEIKAEMERVKGHSGSTGDKSRKAVLKQLEEKLQAEETAGKQYHVMAEKSSKLLEQVMVCIDKNFTTLECDETKIIEQQGTAGLTENNIQLYLASIELRTDEYLARWRRIHGAPEKGPQFPFGSTQISIDIPSTGDDYNEGYSDEEERVLTRDELLMKTNQKISKQQQQGQEYRHGKSGKRQNKKKPAFPST